MSEPNGGIVRHAAPLHDPHCRVPHNGYCDEVALEWNRLRRENAKLREERDAAREATIAAEMANLNGVRDNNALRVMLAKHQWGYDGMLWCLECDGIHPDAEYTARSQVRKGHAPDCALAALLGESQ